jgi:hypothetical protein
MHSNGPSSGALNNATLWQYSPDGHPDGHFRVHTGTEGTVWWQGESTMWYCITLSPQDILERD